MENLISRAKFFLHNRFTGKVTEHIETIENILEIVDTIPNQHFWLSWYRKYLKSLYNHYRLARFIPGRFITLASNATKNALDEITEGNKLVLKDIFLPCPIKNSDKPAFFETICNSLLPYLLNDIDTEVLYQLSGFTSEVEGLYEYKNIRLKENEIVIDAGANIGDFSALAGISGSKAFAFEPMPSCQDNYLSKTAKMNRNITICDYALSDKRDELDFFDNCFGSASFIRKNQGANKIKVKTIDLDTFVKENNLPSVDFIKADIEGAERYMLRGAKQVLKEFSPKLAICTYHLPDDPQVLRELILDANPDYIIEERWKKMYAYVPKQ